MRRVISYRFDNPQTFGAPFTEEYSIPCSQVLRSLNKPECHYRTVPSPYKSSINVNDSTRLRNWTDMQHGLVLGLDRSSMAKDQDYRNSA